MLVRSRLRSAERSRSGDRAGALRDSIVTAPRLRGRPRGFILLSAMTVRTSAPLSAREAADYCGVNERTIRNWLRSGRLSAEKSAGVFRIPLEALEPFRRGRPPSSNGAETDDPRSGPDRRGVSAVVSARELLSVVERQQQTIIELSGRCGYLQAELETARTRILALEAPKEAPEPAPRPWWAFWRDR